MGLVELFPYIDIVLIFICIMILREYWVGTESSILLNGTGVRAAVLSGETKSDVV